MDRPKSGLRSYRHWHRKGVEVSSLISRLVAVENMPMEGAEVACLIFCRRCCHHSLEVSPGEEQKTMRGGWKGLERGVGGAVRRFMTRVLETTRLLPLFYALSSETVNSDVPRAIGMLWVLCAAHAIQQVGNPPRKFWPIRACLAVQIK